MPVLRGSGSQVGGWIRGTVVVAGLGALALGAARPAAAQCFAPFALADRWDDVTTVPGYTGGSHKTPDWRGDNVCDHEAFTDTNGNGMYDPGETFVDANANGVFDAELYSPILTGFVLGEFPDNLISPHGDDGLQFALAPTGPGDEAPGHYVFIQTTCTSRIIGAERVAGADLKIVDAALRAAIAADPGASWDDATRAIVGSAFPPGESPRVLIVEFYDPRSPLAGSHGAVRESKEMGLFVEAMTGKGAATARLTRLPVNPSTPGTLAAPTGGASPVQARATWGELKAGYR